MCNPAAVAAIGVVGTAESAAGAIQEGKAQQNYYNYLAAQNEVQANRVKSAGNYDVGLVAGAGAREDLNLDRSASVVAGEQRAAASAGGVYGGSKTSEDIAADTANKLALDRAAIKQNADLQSRKIAYESEGEAQNLRSQAVGFRYAGENARSAGTTNAWTSVLGGATNVADRWYQWRQVKG